MVSVIKGGRLRQPARFQISRREGSIPSPSANGSIVIMGSTDRSQRSNPGSNPGRSTNGPVAQLGVASDWQSGGRRFKSGQVHNSGL